MDITVKALDEQTRMDMLQRMLDIRYSEEQIQGLFLANLVRGTTHLCDGQEACSVGVAWALKPGDMMTCTYRGHGHALAMGISIKTLMAEMMGKASGCCGGKGGSMHMTDASVGLLGANAIVGAGLPIAVGAALTSQVKGSHHVTVALFGDGAVNIGAFHEALNMAAVWKLPVVFICENNLYGEYSPLHTTTAVENIADRACAYNIPGLIVDGQDVEVVHAHVSAAVERARAGDGPSLVELKTYRYRGHSRTDTGPYRPEGELEAWLQRDPIHILRDRMIEDGQLDAVEFEELQQATERKVAEALEWAKNEPFPLLEAAYQDVYAGGR
ncbi:MAG: thiamine pyrophosphate-dependent dehydrogenase E1 component subunit alpha [Chloroflexi bacterium]|nr:MAG: pyruvate dehydrogenase (acetyl-transferring) E1 component subunit alpha [Phototrophicales bacterium]RMF82718.1 MAG: thiamine pyrophosphate-dependent dehydrogenase E1 component subunit alpha [Chloroflexota bacterium]